MNDATAWDRRFFVLFQAIKAVTSAPTLKEMSEWSLKLLLEVTAAERAVVALVRPEDSRLEPRWACARGTGVMPVSGASMPKAVAEGVIREKAAVVSRDALDDQRFRDDAEVSGAGVRSMMCVPIWEGKRVYGLVYLDHRARAGAFEREDLDFVTAMAPLFAIRIELDELRAGA